MNYRAWKHKDAADASKHDERHGSRFSCVLGVNQSTGRVQWCPGCRYAKVMLLIPVALAPVVLVLLLLSRSGQSGVPNDARITGHNVLDESSTGNVFDEQRCTAIRYSMTETLENEDRDLLKDTRTSFIPPDYLYAPPNCGGPIEDADSLNDFDYVEDVRSRNELVDDWSKRNRFTDNKHYDNYYYRQRRDAIAMPSHNETTLIDSKVANQENAMEHTEPLADAEIENVVADFSARPIEGISLFKNTFLWLYLIEFIIA